jgi:hypothetical protein
MTTHRQRVRERIHRATERSKELAERFANGSSGTVMVDVFERHRGPMRIILAMRIYRLLADADPALAERFFTDSEKWASEP